MDDRSQGAEIQSMAGDREVPARRRPWQTPKIILASSATNAESVSMLNDDGPSSVS